MGRCDSGTFSDPKLVSGRITEADDTALLFVLKRLSSVSDIIFLRTVVVAHVPVAEVVVFIYDDDDDDDDDGDVVRYTRNAGDPR
jgi:hypothetical protein